jgi:hypothetical protein
MDISTIGNKFDDINVEISYRIIQLFSAGLYSSPNKAFEELVCNSYDAFANIVSVFVPSDLTVDGAYIWVCDNGEGLDSSELKDLWRIGESSKRKNIARDKKRLQIGQFGIGKLATYVLARKLTYISKKNNRYILATMDYDLIKEEVKHLTLDEREINENQAFELLSFYTNLYNGGKLEFDLFGKDASPSWTMSILTDLRTKALEMKEGRLKWVLRTALPLNPGFNLFYNGSKVESSKIDIPVAKQWIIGNEDKTADAIKDTVCYKDNGKYCLDFPNLKGIYGEFTLYKDSLLDGKSTALGRSHGIFLNVRGRLINLDDPLLGMEAFSHGAFNRTRIIINADELDSNLTSTREAIKESSPYSQLKEYIKKKFNNEVRSYYFDEANREAEEKTISYRLSQTSYATSKRPIYKFVQGFYDKRISNPFLIEKPSFSAEKGIRDYYEKDVESGSQIIENVEELPLATGAPIAKLNLETRTLVINTVHPFIANYKDAYQNTLPLQSIAITEVLTEAHLYELGMDDSVVNQIMRKRDTTLRELALSDRDGIPAVALLVKDAVSDPTGLEEAVYRALLALGFETVKISGRGEPDGKAEAILGYNPEGKSLNYSLTYDAKSTNKDRIAAETAHLSGLKRHQEKYKADYCLEVAIGYQGESDPESAICKESTQQKVTIITARNLIKLLFLATPKQLGLNKLRDLFETCHTPIDVEKWIDNLSSTDVEKPPYYDIIDIVYDLQSNDIELPNVASVRLKLNEKLKCQYKSTQIKGYITILQGLLPGLISLEGEYVSIQNSASTIKSRISRIINNDIPEETKALYQDLFVP